MPVGHLVIRTLLRLRPPTGANILDRNSSRKITNLPLRHLQKSLCTSSEVLWFEFCASEDVVGCARQLLASCSLAKSQEE